MKISSKSRILWIKWHAYISCFFLPFALLIALTGVLYLFEIKGGASEKFEYTIETELDFPLPKAQLEAAIKNKFSSLGVHSELFPLPVEYFEIIDMQGWWDFDHEILITDHGDGAIKVIIEENNLWRQMVFIHKGIAGKAFFVFSVLFAISLIFSLLSGTVVALVMPKMKRNASIFIGVGFLSIMLIYGLS